MSNTIAKFTFAPWVRQGLGTQLSRTDSSALVTPTDKTIHRADIAVNIKLKVNGAVITDDITQSVTILGAAEVKGIDPEAIVRVEPAKDINSFEPNFFPFVEFYDEDFPWRFSPSMPTLSDTTNPSFSNRLKPWLFLAVLKETEFDSIDSTNGNLPSIKIKGSILPDFSQLWSIAHVHINQEITDLTASGLATTVTGIQASNPDLAFSRVMSLRKLEEKTKYHAFLIPTYEVGRQKGLNPDATLNANVHDPAQGFNGEANISFPVYYTWTFSTGAQGDFEALATKLVPRVIDARVGARPMDIGPALDLLKQGYDKTTTPPTASALDSTINLNVEGALKTSTTNHVDWGNTNKLVLQKLLNLSEDIKTKTVPTGTSHPLFPSGDLSQDPIVLPPIYGKWHARTTKLNGTGGWINQLNLDPQYRVAAGLGSLIIQQNQEFFMDYAWQQVGEIIEANKKIAMAELSHQLTQGLLDVNVKSIDVADRILPLTSSLQKKIVTAPNQTVQASISQSILPNASQSQAFKKFVRPRGAIAKKLNVGVASPVSNGVHSTIITNLNTTASPVKAFTPTENLTTGIALRPDMVTGAKNKQLATGGSTASLDKLAATNTFAQLESLASLPSPLPKPPVVLGDIKNIVLAKLEPLPTFINRVNKILKITPNPALFYTPTKLKAPLAYPKFPFTMFDYLYKLSKDLVIPNIEYVSDETISLLSTNQKFIESFFVGLNHEMGREMLWREYPTDQRGSYFRRFWSRTDDVKTMLSSASLTDDQKEDALSDIMPINTWTGASNLGTHLPGTTGTTAADKVTLLIRGELLRKFPNAIIYAQKAEFQKKANGTIDNSLPRLLKEVDESQLGMTNLIQFPRFQAKVDPDIHLLGFDLSTVQAKGSGTTSTDDPDGSGWFFVLKERSGQIRFGLDLADAEPATPIEDWDNLNNKQVQYSASGYVNPSVDPTKVNKTKIPQWNTDSAQLAYALYQDPVLVAIHASDMLGTL